MPGKGIQRAKRLRAGALGQSSRFYYLGSNSFAKIAGGQGFGKTNASIGSMRSLGIMKQNRKAGGNNICKETTSLGYKVYQDFEIIVSGSDQNDINTITENTLIYIYGTPRIFGKVINKISATKRTENSNTRYRVQLARNIRIAPGTRNLISLTPPDSPSDPDIWPPPVNSSGTPGEIIVPNDGGNYEVVKVMVNNACGCNGPKAYCPNCSGRNNPFGAITGANTYSSTTGFTLLTH